MSDNTPEPSSSTPAVTATTEAEVIKLIESLNQEYNDSVESLAEAEALYQDTEGDLFSSLIGGMNIESDEKPTPACIQTLKSFVENKQTLQSLLKKQSKSFRLLQKLRVVQINYANSIIQAQQEKLQQAPAAESSS